MIPNIFEERNNIILKFALITEKYCKGDNDNVS